jgi:multiple sugar transport system permease protein
VGVLTFWLYWSDFINPLLYLKSQSLYTLPIGVRQLQQLNRTNWPLLMAAAVVATAPAALVFLTVQRFLLNDGRRSE